MVGPGIARRGEARIFIHGGNLLFNRGTARLGRARHGKARQGEVGKMSNEKDLRYYQAKSSALESKVVQYQDRIRGLERIIFNYRDRAFPSGTEESTKNAVEDRWAKQSEGNRRLEEKQRRNLRRNLK